MEFLLWIVAAALFGLSLAVNSQRLSVGLALLAIVIGMVAAHTGCGSVGVEVCRG